MVPETHEIEFPTSDELRKFLISPEFRMEYAQKFKEQYVVEVTVGEPRQEKQGEQTITLERLALSYTRNNAGGLKDAVDFLLLPLMSRGLDANAVKGAIPRPKSDSFEDNMPYFESKLLQRAEPPVSNDSPTRASFPGAGEVGDGSSRSLFDKLRKPGSMSSFSSFIERRRKNGTSSPGSLFMHASSNASKASLASMESRDSGYRNPWKDSGIDLDHDGNATTSNGNGNGGSGSGHGNGWGSFSTTTSRPNTSSNSLSGAFETKFPFGANGNASTSSLNTPMIPGLGMATTPTGMASGAAVAGSSSLGASAGDATPKYDAKARSADGFGKAANGDAGRSEVKSEPAVVDAIKEEPAATSSSTAESSGYPAPIAPPQ